MPFHTNPCGQEETVHEPEYGNETLAKKIFAIILFGENLQAGSNFFSQINPYICYIFLFVILSYFKYIFNSLQ